MVSYPPRNVIVGLQPALKGYSVAEMKTIGNHTLPICYLLLYTAVGSKSRPDVFGRPGCRTNSELSVNAFQTITDEASNVSLRKKNRFESIMVCGAL